MYCNTFAKWQTLFSASYVSTILSKIKARDWHLLTCSVQSFLLQRVWSGVKKKSENVSKTASVSDLSLGYNYDLFTVFYLLKIFGPPNCLRTVPTNSKVFLRGLLNTREKQILTSVIEIQNENWG